MHWVEQAQEYPWQAGSIFAGLLAVDIYIPIPSSLVSTACGVALGWPLGMFFSFIGMTISLVIGYFTARALGARLEAKNQAVFPAIGEYCCQSTLRQRAIATATGPADVLCSQSQGCFDQDAKQEKQERIHDAQFNQLGAWAIAITRPIPVLAEAAVLWAGYRQVAFKQVFLIGMVSNLIVSGIYAFTGDLVGTETNSFLWALGAVVVLSALTLGLYKLIFRHRGG